LSRTCAGTRLGPNLGSVTHVIKVRVSNVDAVFIRAREAGAGVIGEPTSYEFGERSCMLEDLAGHRWELTQTVRDVEPAVPPESWRVLYAASGMVAAAVS